MFHQFAQAVHQNFVVLSTEELFTTDCDDIFSSYLSAFPEGTNPIFRTRTEHDCACCKQFLRTFGKVVSIIDGKKQTLWSGLEALPEPYATVAARLDAIVGQAPISGIFRSKERAFGAEVTYQAWPGGAISWHHFHGRVAQRHYTAKPEEVRGEAATGFAMLNRAVSELSSEALAQVRDLIENDTLYRGKEMLHAVQAFAKLAAEANAAPDKNLFLWSQASSPISRFRNTAIGSLVVDLSEGMDLEAAVRAFESKVAPTNYRRPKALLTPAMVKAAEAKIEALGLAPALSRRFAKLSDLSIRDVLFVNTSTRALLTGQSLGELLSGALAPAKPPTGQKMAIEEFQATVLPQAKSLALFLSNHHLPNFVSLTAPTSDTAPRLFAWDNSFAWSYDGDTTDSIKERVKRAGGNTGAALRVSLAWDCSDDLDIHADCPDGRVFYANKLNILDVDMNAHRVVKDPVENLSWARPRAGTYRIAVHNFNQRTTTPGGFTIELECNGALQQWHCAAKPTDSKYQECLTFQVKDGAITSLSVDKALIGGSNSTLKWGLETQRLTPVSALFLSPNHWEGAGGRGAKHWFFALENCHNPEPIRGIYNEFLRSDLAPHRKVFEALGQRTRCAPVQQQLSGVGFTKGREQEVLLQVETQQGTRPFSVQF